MPGGVAVGAGNCLPVSLVQGGQDSGSSVCCARRRVSKYVLTSSTITPCTVSVVCLLWGRVTHQSLDATYYRTPLNIRTMIPKYDL